MNRARLAKLVLWAACTAGPAAALAGWRIDGVPQGGATAYGTGPASAYRGDWGAAVSNLAAGAVQSGGGSMSGWLYFHGEEAVDGSWRLGYAGGSVVMQVRAGGVWTNTVQFLAP